MKTLVKIILLMSLSICGFAQDKPVYFAGSGWVPAQVGRQCVVIFDNGNQVGTCKGKANRQLLADWFRGIYTNASDSKVYTVWTNGTDWYYESAATQLVDA